MKKMMYLVAFMLTGIMSVKAQDKFEKDGLYYKVTSNVEPYTVELIPQNDSEPYWSNAKPRGDINIPATITRNGKTYSVTSIGVGAFWDCTSLTSVSIPNSVTSIGHRAFEESGLASVEIPNSVTSIGVGAFRYCQNLGSIIIPDSVTSIKTQTFLTCTSLTSVVIPESVTSIGDSAFGDCRSLTSVEIPNSVTSIGDTAFASCLSLTSVSIPSSVTSIERNTFASCTSLTSVEIPNSVTSIGEGVFLNCTSLATITSRIIEPANVSLGADVFENVDKNTCVLNVPAGSEEKYKAAEQWKEFMQVLDVKASILATNIVVYPNPVVDVLHIQSADASISQVSIYDITGKLLKSTKEILIDFSAYPSGLYFIEIETLGGKVTKKLLKQ